MKRFRRLARISFPATGAIVTLALSPAAPAQSEMLLHIRGCGDVPIAVSIPVKNDKSGGDENCAKACHAMCSRKKIDNSDDGGEGEDA